MRSASRTNAAAHGVCYGVRRREMALSLLMLRKKWCQSTDDTETKSQFVAYIHTRRLQVDGWEGMRVGFE
jgi:hypothetical protein